jgi:protein-S-isoprenylcysteine O-methyltransferase Ste14
MNVNEARIKQEMFAAAQMVIGFFLLALVLLGIGGTIYKVISPDGWVAQALGRSVSAGVVALGSLIMIAALAWFSRGWNSPLQRNRYPELFVYGFATAGLLYIAQLLVVGNF